MRSRASAIGRGFGLALIPAMLAGATTAAPFTGPIAPYFLDNFDTQRIYVVQGPRVQYSFPWAYESGNGAFLGNEGNLALTGAYVTTNGFGSFYGAPATAGQYQHDGTPTGMGHVAQPTHGFSGEIQYDGTSDERHNYTVQYRARIAGGVAVEDVIQTDLNWQNPILLFSVLARPGASLKEGITYDLTNNSLWISDWATGTMITDYSMSGTILSSFDTGLHFMGSLAFDLHDQTLWITYDETNQLYQFSRSGELLQTGIPEGLPSGLYLAGEILPEPASVALVAAGLVGLGLIRHRGGQRAGVLSVLEALRDARLRSATLCCRT